MLEVVRFLGCTAVLPFSNSVLLEFKQYTSIQDELVSLQAEAETLMSSIVATCHGAEASETNALLTGFSEDDCFVCDIELEGLFAIISNSNVEMAYTHSPRVCFVQSDF